MKEKERIFDNYDEEREEVITPPYYKIMYIDDYGYKHLATIKDINYLSITPSQFSHLVLISYNSFLMSLSVSFLE